MSALVPGQHISYANTPEGYTAEALLDLALAQGPRGTVFLAEDEAEAAQLEAQLRFFAPRLALFTLPGWDCLPYDRVSPQPGVMAARLDALAALKHPPQAPWVLLTTVSAFLQRVAPPEKLGTDAVTLKAGAQIRTDLLNFLAAHGYARVSTVREPGEYAVRGDIVDLYPAAASSPLRLDFFGDELEKLRAFDPLSQVTTEDVAALALRAAGEVVLTPENIAHFRAGYREAFGVPKPDDPLYAAISEGRPYPGMEHWLPLFQPGLVPLSSYLPKEAAIVGRGTTKAAIDARFQHIDDFYSARRALYEAAKKGDTPYKPLPPTALYLGPEEALVLLAPFAQVTFETFADGADAVPSAATPARDFGDIRATDPHGLYAAVAAYLREEEDAGRRVLIAAYSEGSADRLVKLFEEHDVTKEAGKIARIHTLAELQQGDRRRIAFGILPLEHGYRTKAHVVVTEADILGDRLARPHKRRRKSDEMALELGSLNPGDLVVHVDAGIGRYEGLETITVAGLAHDCLKLVYAGGDRLYLPVENLDLLSRFGHEDSNVALDRLGGAGWQERKSRLKKRLKDMAEALLKIAAARELKSAPALHPDPGVMAEFAARFPYAETEDQERAIDQVLEDIGETRPMDRLICGDVGFGKTEVALRAAFAAAISGVQVAVVVPTTLLARQHYQNFVRRFKGFPLRVAQLSRFVPAKEAKAVKEEMKDGKIDVVVGTHALLAPSIAFHDLGLVIVDEEQHFGVKQKERLKQLQDNTHVLTMTATPIPRTLQLALAGVRELSMITTPPVDRLAVRTTVMAADPVIIREALMREHFRGGQSFYVAPRIEDLPGLAENLRELVPELKLVTAHGQLSPTELEDIMAAFDDGQFDILLATNIIESGIDIPRANTIVLHRSDLFGLAQLYQLRGRVGRAKQRGYAYLTYPQNHTLSASAEQRLKVMAMLDQLGAGFQLASHDLDIRGAGNLLGEEQSGHIREVGIELYQQMLKDAVEEARHGGVGREEGQWSPTINIGLAVLIPETYVPDLGVRLALYKRLADLPPEESIDTVAAELVDRFGPMPPEVENLLSTIELKQLCRRAGVEKCEAGPKGAIITFHKNSFARPDALLRHIQQHPAVLRVRPDQKLVVVRPWDDPAVRLAGLKKVMAELAGLAEGAKAA